MTTINEYERVLDKVVIPELGGLRLREVRTSRLDLFLVRLRATSVSLQRKTKVVMGAMLGMAVCHDALTVSPVQQTSRIHRERSETRSLTLEDLITAREALRACTAKQRPGPQASIDLADIIDLMPATGARIGEILALRWTDGALDATRPILSINGTVKTEPDKGTYRKPSPRSDASVRTVVLPDFAIAVLRRVGAGIANQQLGHSSPAITREFYISKPAIAADVAHVLEELADVGPERGPNTSGICGEQRLWVQIQNRL